MQNLINKLPDDIIINHIIPYTYNLQDKTLLDDIKNYNQTKFIILKLYQNYWLDEMNETEPEDKWWLINDLFGYTNHYNATMYGYIENFYNIFRRNSQLNIKTTQNINFYLVNLQKKEVDVQINIFWGLFTPEERNDFIEIFLSENAR